MPDMDLNRAPLGVRTCSELYLALAVPTTC
jgi:hypothetical protein